jgi:sugar lactone lactonase YvrE
VNVKEYASGMIWGEGPRWHDGALWLSDTQGSRLWTDTSGTWQSISVDSPSNGLWFLPDGQLVGAMMHERRIGYWDGSGWQTYADLASLGVGPLGDMIGDASGNLYVDDVAFKSHAGEPPVPGRVILVRPDKSTEVVAEGLEFPNGLAFIDDGKTLLVVESSAQRLTAFDVLTDGRLGASHVYADVGALVGPGTRPDGIWPAANGIWVATLSGLAVVRVGESELLETVDTAPLHPIACCLREDGSLLVTVADTNGTPLMEALKTNSVTTSAILIESAHVADRD